MKTIRPVMSPDVVLDFMRRVRLLAKLPASELQIAARAARPISKKKGARIFEEGSLADSCFFITQGRAKVVLSGQAGAEVTVGTVEPFELVGELSLLDGAPRSAGLVALSDCRLIQLPKPAFDQLRKNAAFDDELFHHVARMLRRATEQLRVSYTYSSTERVAWCLAKLAARSGPRVGDTIAISPKPSHQELADMVGCTRETVSRALQRLKSLRCLSWDAGALHLNERAFRAYLEPDSTAETVDIARVV